MLMHNKTQQKHDSHRHTANPVTNFSQFVFDSFIGTIIAAAVVTAAAAIMMSKMMSIFWDYYGRIFVDRVD
jgi:hypothetical protein